MKKTLLLCSLGFIFLVVSCSEKHDKLERALQLAGDNRTELEKVLNHYVNDSNPYKLEAARFLIENMPGHYSYHGRGIQRYYNDIDSLLQTDMTAFDMIAESERISLKYPNLAFNTIEDVRIITSDYLIRNIDAAFKHWEEKPWAEHLTFEQFCEYLLPYKCLELQELDHWRDTLSARFGSGLENRLPNDQYRYSVYDAAAIVNKDIKEKLDIIEPGAARAYQGYYYLSASTMSRIRFGNCDIVANLLNCVLRAQGIPSMVEYVPMWGRRNGTHPFYTVLDEKGNFLPVMFGFDSEPGTPFTAQTTTPKILRKTYKPNERIVEYNRKRTYQGHEFPVFELDVTDLYVTTDDLSIPVSTNKRLKGRYAYISVFSNRQWTLIDFGELKDRKAHFSKVARDHVYLIWGYDGTRLVPISEPFIIFTNGRIEYLTPETNRTAMITVKRKYPKLYDIAFYESRMIGGKIQASNRSDFADAETLYVYDNMPFPDIVTIRNVKPYRYWRYLSPTEGFGNVAEVEFYRQGCDSIAKCIVIGTGDRYNKDPSGSRESAFDGDPLTFVDTQSPNDSWVGLDFSSPVLIDRVRCIPRSDDNDIRIGDRYELYYWGDGQWHSLGAQLAEERILYYNAVPSNVLLWLRNHTRGKEERIFTYEDGEQRWW